MENVQNTGILSQLKRRLTKLLFSRAYENAVSGTEVYLNEVAAELCKFFRNPKVKSSVLKCIDQNEEALNSIIKGISGLQLAEFGTEVSSELSASGKKVEAAAKKLTETVLATLKEMKEG